MPKVVGEKFEDAEKMLTELGIKIEKVEEISQTIEEGYVTSQETKETTDVEVGTVVKIHVSKGNGKKKFKVAYVIGKNVEDAKKELTELGMEVNIKEKEDMSQSEGIVLEQSIPEETDAQEGDKITLTVNKIKANVEGTININVKSLVEKYASDDEEGSSNKNVTIKIVVGNDKIYEKTIPKTTEKINQTFEGKGVVTIKVYINGIKANGKDYTLDLNGENKAITIS